MTKKDQRRIIRELTNSIKNSMLNSVDKMPSYWNGFEIRQLCADLAKEATANMDNKWKTKYINDRYNLNI